MSNQNGYIGRAPADSSIIIATQKIEPAGIQTTFTFNSGYDPGYIDVYKNGLKLVVADDYTASDGSTVSLTSSVGVGTVLELIAYKAFNLGTVNSSGGNFTVGDDLTVSGATTATTAYYTGIVTASSFSGDGSSLTGVANTDFINATQLNVIGVTTVGAAVTINSTGIDAVSGVITATTFKGALTGVAASATALETGRMIGGVVFDGTGDINLPGVNQSGTQNTSGTAAGLSGTPDITVNNITGVAATFTGVLTYEDVTNVDSVGIVTARGGLEVGAAGVGGTISSGGNVIFAGITTVGAGLTLLDDIRAKFGNSGDLQIYANGSHSFIAHNGDGNLKITTGASGEDILLQSFGDIDLKPNDGDNGVKVLSGASVELYEAGTKRLETTTTGVSVAGTTISNGGDFITYDNGRFKSGNGAEVSLWHNNTATLGENGYLRNLVGNLNINGGNSAGNIYINLDENVAGVTSDRSASFIRNGGVELYYDNAKRIESTGYGMTVNGGSYVSGVTTAFGGWHGSGTLVESFSSTTTAYNSSSNLNISNGNVHFSSANLGGTGTTLNIMSTTGINTDIRVNQALNVTAFTAVNATTAFVNKVTIDGKATGITTHWVGGSVPEDGGGSGVDTYSFNILKTGSETYIIVANQVKTS